MVLATKLILLTVCGALVQATVYSERGGSTKALYNQRGDFVRIYPNVDGPIDNVNYSYFGDRLDFNSVNDSILIGGADKLFLFDKNLSPVEDGVLTWMSNGCNGNSINDPVTCRNHIRVYESIPGEDNLLFVCGTFATSPRCTTVEVSNGSLAEMESSTPAFPGIISPDPNLPGFGEFRRSDLSDARYFSANFRTTQTNAFDLSYQELISGSQTSRLYGLQFDSDKWLKNPLFFVDYIRADYRSARNQPEDYQFYFVFLRESLNNAEREIVVSRVIRICRNDAGVSNGMQQQIFSSYLKAMIFCEREIPPGNRFVGAQNYQYNEIWSVALNDREGGRFVDGGIYSHLMYGAFSGPLIGPSGTAICVYHADNSGSADMSNGFNRGLFDIFRENVVNTDDSNMVEREPRLVECDPGGRDSDEAQFVNVAQNMGQIGEDPLVIFEGFHVTQIAVDVVCVVSKSNMAQCYNQDVLFLGTSTGKVMKVVFTSSTAQQNSMTPVISEEIELDDTNPVNEMKIEIVDGVKQLYVATDSRLYRLPLESCDRYNLDDSFNDTTRFNVCVGSRDPYCVWNSVNNTCEASQLIAEGSGLQSVPSYILQNISGPIELPFVEFPLSSYKVSEGVGIVELIVTSTRPVPDGIVLVQAFSESAKHGLDFSLLSRPMPINFSGDTLQASITIEIADNAYYDPARSKSFRLQLVSSVEHVDVLLGVKDVTVTISDDEDVPLVNISRSTMNVRSVRELAGNATFMVSMTTTVPMTSGLVELTVEDGTARANVDYSTPSPMIVMFEGMVGTSTLSVEILHRSGYQGNRNFSLVLRNTEQGAVLFGEQRELVWILDDDGAPFRLVIATLDKVCSQWIMDDYDKKLDTVVRTVAKGLSLESLDDITDGSLFCNNAIEDEFYVEFQAVVRTKRGEASSTISSLEAWAQTLPTVDNPYSQLKVLYSGSCPVMIFASNDPPCILINLPEPGGLGESSANSSGAVTGVSVTLAVTIIILIVVLVLNGLFLWRHRKAVFIKETDKPVGGTNSEYQDQPPENSLTRLSHSFNISERPHLYDNVDSVNGGTKVDLSHETHDVVSDV